MKVEITLGEEFKRQFKLLAKKYHSLTNDLIAFKAELIKNPLQGDDLGCGIRKVRMAISSKGRGKSGGARVLTLNVLVNEMDTTNVVLLTIYDKSEIDNVSDNYIKWLVEQYRTKR